MKFRDDEIERLHLTDVDSICQLIIKYLCGEKYCKESLDEERIFLPQLLENATRDGLNYQQFNELLLLLDQDRLSNAFFKFFFEKEKISLDELKDGIIKFRGYAMLCFGNFRFAYKRLSQKNEGEVEKALKLNGKEPAEILKEFKNRPPKMLDIKHIDKDKTWYAGFIVQKKLEKEIKELQKSIHTIEEGDKKAERLGLLEEYTRMEEERIEIEEKALKNTDVYLTWDYMDVYIATSMRHGWEFEDVCDFINEVFVNNDILNHLNLRYFDPTQSKCNDRIDKGLIEGLMLKRVLCSIYMAQESDTLGKDSELAATLAQSKPVIAYVPKYDIDEYAEKIKKYPLDFFEKRFLILKAEEIFQDKDCIDALESYDRGFSERIDNFQKELDRYRSAQPFSLWYKKEEDFKRMYSEFFKICKILAIAEIHNFENRAKTLREIHPLAIQVDLQSGVANGVLVVRSLKECAELLYKILTNSLEFTIVHLGEKGKGVTVLKENISKCPYRVVTDYEKLTNSFWNFWPEV